jgi:16S rRNA (guanine527-N7)-methyltransferase
VKLSNISSLKVFLETEAIILTADQIQQLEFFYQALIEWSTKLNLVSRGDRNHMLERHFLMSFYFVKILKDLRTEKNKIMDLGTGAGFPGIIISIYFQNSKVVLIDSSRKKSIFLSYVLKKLDLNAEIICERVEKLPEIYDKHFDVITARAVSSMENLVTWTMPRLNNNGYLLTVKGSQFENELGPFRNLISDIKIYPVQTSWSNYSTYLSEKFFIKMEKIHDCKENF